MNQEPSSANRSVGFNAKRLNISQSPVPNQGERQPLIPEQCMHLQRDFPMPKTVLPCDVRLLAFVNVVGTREC